MNQVLFEDFKKDRSTYSCKFCTPVAPECNARHNGGNVEPTHPTEHSYSVEKSSDFGNHLITSRDLKPGEVVLDERPGFFGPSADYIEDYSTPVCLGCCVVMNDGNQNARCLKCLWPICSKDCKNVSSR